MMIKKEYITPAIEVVEMELTSMLALSNDDELGIFEGEGEELSNGRRGQWGNLWADK